MVKYPINSLLKSVFVLRCFTLKEPELGLADITRKAGMPKTTVHRILSTLAEAGLMERSVKTGRYRIGPGLYALGSLYLHTTDIISAAEPVVKALNELAGENMNLSIFNKGNVVFIMKEEAMYAFRFDRHIGSILPAYASSMGKAFLSELTEAELDSIYPSEKLQPITGKTITTKTQLKLELEQIRKTGISFDREEYTIGIAGFGAVIRNVSGKAVAAMCIALPAFKVHENSADRFITLVKLGVSLISYRLGYQGAIHTVHDIEEIRSWWKQSQLVPAAKVDSPFQDSLITSFDEVIGAKVDNQK